MTVWGYARVSTHDQTLDAQCDALRRAGVPNDALVVEKASGARSDRPELATLLSLAQPGDTITVVRLDRLGRSLSHLVQVVEQLTERGIGLRSLSENIDADTPGGRMQLHIFAALAEFERELVRERTRDALSAARARGKAVGRPSPITKEQAALIRRLDAEGLSQGAISRSTGVSRAAVGRFLRGEIASLRHSGEPQEQ